MLTREEKQILESQKTKILIEWWEELNSWKWPQKIPNKEEIVMRGVKYTRRWALMKWIRNKIGLQAILRSHNKHMTKREFKDFWRGTQRKSKKAWRRYIKRLRNPKYSQRVKRNLLKESITKH